MILELAENANTYTTLGPDEERIVDDRYVLWLGPWKAPWATVVQRLRLPDLGVEEAVAEIRGIVRSHGRSACTWEIGGSATPADLRERLLALGCVPDREPYAVGMALRAEPVWSPASGVTARRVETLDEMRTAIRIAAAGFDAPPDELDESLARAETQFAQEGERGATYLAWVRRRARRSRLRRPYAAWLHPLRRRDAYPACAARAPTGRWCRPGGTMLSRGERPPSSPTPARCRVPSCADSASRSSRRSGFFSTSLTSGTRLGGHGRRRPSASITPPCGLPLAVIVSIGAATALLVALTPAGSAAPSQTAPELGHVHGLDGRGRRSRLTSRRSCSRTTTRDS